MLHLPFSDLPLKRFYPHRGLGGVDVEHQNLLCGICCKRQCIGSSEKNLICLPFVQIALQTEKVILEIIVHFITQRRRDDNKNKIIAFEGGRFGGREENRPKTLFFFRGKRHDNNILNVWADRSREFTRTLLPARSLWIFCDFLLIFCYFLLIVC